MPVDSPSTTATEFALPTADEVRMLSGAPLQQLHVEVLGQAPKPRTPAPVLRRRIVIEIERRRAVATTEQPVSESAPKVDKITAAIGITAAVALAIHDAEEAEPTSAPPPSEKLAVELPALANDPPVGAPTGGPAITAATAAASAATGQTGANGGAACGAPPDPEHDVGGTARGPDGRATVEKTRIPIGTVLQNLDRNGKVRASCTVVDGGVEFAGQKFTSLSAAAVAASRALGNRTTQTSGPRFWGLVAATPRAKTAKGVDLDVLARAFAGYRERAEEAVERAGAEHKTRLQQMLSDQSSAVLKLVATIADDDQAAST